MKNTPPIVARQASMRSYYPQQHRRRVLGELKKLGVSWPVLHTTEARYLPHIIHEGEHIGGIAYGWIRTNFTMLIATDRRLIYLDKKPLFVDEEDISYGVVSGVDLSSTGIDATLTLHTRIRDYVMYTLNSHCAQGFANFIETHCLDEAVPEM